MAKDDTTVVDAPKSETKAQPEVKTNEQSDEQAVANFRDSILKECMSRFKKELARNAPAQFSIPKELEETPFLGDWLTNLRDLHAQPDTRKKEKAFNTLCDKWDYETLKDQQAVIHKTAPTGLEQTVSGAGLELVPQIYAPDLLKWEGIQPVIYGGPGTFTMTSNIVKYPSWNYGTTPSGGNSAFAGGFTVQVVGEGNYPTEVAPQTQQLTWTADKHLGLMDISNELLDNNNVNVVEQVRELTTFGLISYTDYSFFNGNGAHITGFIGDGATFNQPRQTVSTFGFTDLANMYKHLIPSLVSNACWVMHPSCVGTLLQLSDQANRIIYFEGLNVTGAPSMRLFGLPVYVNDNCGTLGSEADVCLLGRRAYGVGINKALEIAISPHFKFGYDLVTLRILMRVAGRPRFLSTVLDKTGTFPMSWAITLKNTTS